MKKPEVDDIHGRKAMLVMQKKKFSEQPMPEINRQLILEYITGKTVDDNLSIGRQEKIFSVMRVIAEKIGDLSIPEINKDQLLEIWRAVKTVKPKKYRKVKEAKDKPYVMKLVETGDSLKPSTIRTYGIIYVALWDWLLNKKEVMEASEAMKLLKVLKEDIKKKLPTTTELIQEPRREDLLTWEEACQISNQAYNNRDRALVQALWDSGMSAEEFLTLRFQDVEFVDNNSACYLRVQKVKNKYRLRDVFIIDSVPALKIWADQHPTKKPDDSFWIHPTTGIALNYNSCRTLIKKLAVKAGITKPVNLHNFRKSEYSADRFDLSDGEDKKRHGHAPDSKMLAIYKNVNLAKSESKMRLKRGIDKPKDEVVRVGKKCLFCGTINHETSTCILCKRPLDRKEVILELELLKDIEKVWPQVEKKYSLQAEGFIDLLGQLIASQRAMEASIKKLEGKTEETKMVVD